MLAMDVWCFSKSTIRVDLEKHQTRLHYWGNSLCNFEESPLQLWGILLYNKQKLILSDTMKRRDASLPAGPQSASIMTWMCSRMIPALSSQNRKPLMRNLSAVRLSGSLKQTAEKRSVCHQFTMFWKKNSSKTETMRNFPGTNRRSGTTSIILRIPDRSTGSLSTAVSMIMFLTPRPENRC